MCWLFFYWPNTVSSDGYTTFCSSLCKLVAVWTLLTFWIPRVMLLQLFPYQCLLEVLFPFLRSVYLEIELLAHVVMLCLTFWAIVNILRILFCNQPWCPISKRILHPTVKPGVISRDSAGFLYGNEEDKEVRGPRRPHSPVMGIVS